VEDDPSNTTRFVVLAPEKDLPSRMALPGAAVTSFLFRVRNVPSALFKALGGFATNGVNMTRLESYMVGNEFAATMFMADVEGHPEDLPVALALEELDFFTTEVRILGVYAAAEYRTGQAVPG
jgi:prephenate dehydratase